MTITAQKQIFPGNDYLIERALYQRALTLHQHG
jgi:hypothetical protein